MGSGTYSCDSRSMRADTLNYFTKSTAEIFTQEEINNAMNPRGISIRESRDSEEHPNSVAIILGLDVTGSMGSIPHHMIKDGLPTMMSKIIQNGISDPQVLFLGIGDHEVDKAPLQVGQFESSDELLDKWLTDVYLEAGGGANAGESYFLAWYLAGYHTSIDCFEKRSQKGFLFTVGDEPVLSELQGYAIEKIMGDGQYEDFTPTMLLDKAREIYNVYHIHVKETQSGSRQHVMDGWKQLMQDNLIIVDDYRDIPKVIAETVIGNSKVVPVSEAPAVFESEEML